MKKIKKIPKFKSEDEERNFWDSHDLTDYFDMTHPVKMDFSHLQPSTKSISLRLPEFLLYEFRLLANKRDMAYQSLMKFVLVDWVQKERQVQANL